MTFMVIGQSAPGALSACTDANGDPVPAEAEAEECPEQEGEEEPKEEKLTGEDRLKAEGCPLDEDDLKDELSKDSNKCDAYFLKCLEMGVKEKEYDVDESYFKNRRHDKNCNLEFDDSEQKVIDKIAADIKRKEELEKFSYSETGSKFETYYRTYINKDQPYESEFFNVDDEEKGLTTTRQGNRFQTGGGNPVLDFIVRMIELSIQLIGLAALIMVVVGSYYMLTAGGEEEQVSKGKDIIKLALIGVVIAIFSYSIVTFVQAIIY